MAKCLKLYAIYAFSTKPGPCHYTALLNADVLKNFLPNTGFTTIRLLRFGVKVKRAYGRDNFLAQSRGHCQTFACCLETIFCVFQQDGTPAHRIPVRHSGGSPFRRSAISPHCPEWRTPGITDLRNGGPVQ